jgi:hypothetical protein
MAKKTKISLNNYTYKFLLERIVSQWVEDHKPIESRDYVMDCIDELRTIAQYELTRGRIKRCTLHSPEENNGEGEV